MTLTLAESWVIINRGATPLHSCQSSNPWHRHDKDMRCCATVLTLCHFRGAASLAAQLCGWLVFLFLYFLDLCTLHVHDSDCPWLWVQENTLTHTQINTPTHSHFLSGCLSGLVCGFYSIPVFSEPSFTKCPHVVSEDWFWRRLPKPCVAPGEPFKKMVPYTMTLKWSNKVPSLFPKTHTIRRIF